METVESKYTRDYCKPATIDFSSEFGRLMKKGSVMRNNPQVSEVLSRDNESSLVIEIPVEEVQRKKSVPPFRMKSLKVFDAPKISSGFKATSSALKKFMTFTKPGLSTIAYAAKEMPKIPREIPKALDEFSYLPLWFTMPVIFVSSVLIGAIFSIMTGL